MANLFFSSVRPRSLTFYSFTVPNPKPKWKRRLDFGSLPFRPRPNLLVSFSASRGEELAIVSTSECADGSVVFRFGDESEIEEERVRIAASALVDEDVKECEEIEVIDEEIDGITEGLVESGSLAMERIDLVEESGGGLELSETMLEERVNLAEDYVDKEVDSVTKGRIDLVEESVSEDVESESGGGFEMSEAMLEERVNLSEGFVDKDGDSGSDEVLGEIHSGFELSETVLDKSLHLEEGFVDEENVNGDDEGEGGLERNETLLDDSVGLDDENSVNEVDGEIDGGLESSETLANDTVGLEKVFVAKDSVNSTDEVEGETDHGLELSEALLEDIVHVEEGSVETGGDVVQGESDCALGLSETLLEASTDIEEGYVENSGTESDVAELSETLPEASVEIEEGHVKDIVIGNESDVVEDDSDSNHALDLSATLMGASADLEEGHVETSVTESDVVEGDSDSDHALDLSATLMEASADLEEGHVENIGSGSDVEEGESDQSLELTETLPEASVAIEEGYVENNLSRSEMAKQNCDNVLELIGTLKNILQLEEVPIGDDNEEVAELDDVVEVESIGVLNENHESNAEAINVDTEVNNVSDELTYDSDLIQVMPISDTLEAEPILEEETSYEHVDEPIETNQITSLEMVETITEDDAISTHLAEEPIHNPIELQPISLIREEVSRTELFLSSGAALFPVASKALTGREDAYFVASEDWLGVADGVSEWSLQGINVGSYAQELMDNCKKIVLDSERVQLTNPIEVLNRSVSNTKSHGSSTALVAFFDGQALRAANIGDSGFIIVRNETVFKRSSPMVHGINFPIHIERGDDPSQLVEGYDVDLSEDDIIVVATDGLFDNLYEEEIASIASKSAQAGLKPKDIAELLAARALEVGSSATGTSPFADVARAAGYAGRTGGKLDDVAVIVSLVQKRSNPN